MGFPMDNLTLRTGPTLETIWPFLTVQILVPPTSYMENVTEILQGTLFGKTLLWKCKLSKIIIHEIGPDWPPFKKWGKRWSIDLNSATCNADIPKRLLRSDIVPTAKLLRTVRSNAKTFVLTGIWRIGGRPIEKTRRTSEVGHPRIAISIHTRCHRIVVCLLWSGARHISMRRHTACVASKTYIERRTFAHKE